MTVRIPAPLRRAGAYLKAFALLEDPPAQRSMAAGTARQDTGAQAARARSQAAHAARQNASLGRSHQHRRPPRTRIERLAPRRPSTVPAALQPCCTPIAPVRGVRPAPSRARSSRSGSAQSGT